MDTKQTECLPEGRRDLPVMDKIAKGVYPVQQTGTGEPATDPEVQDAVDEINPDKNSLESR